MGRAPGWIRGGCGFSSWDRSIGWFFLINLTTLDKIRIYLAIIIIPQYLTARHNKIAVCCSTITIYLSLKEDNDNYKQKNQCREVFPFHHL